VARRVLALHAAGPDDEQEGDGQGVGERVARYGVHAPQKRAAQAPLPRASAPRACEFAAGAFTQSAFLVDQNFRNFRSKT